MDQHTQGFLDALQRIDARRNKEKEVMPAYDYKCNTCENTITIIRGIADDEQTPICAHCAKVMPRAYDSAPAITFKGKGWGRDA
jgi:putative FmdB family regulatory protein